MIPIQSLPTTNFYGMLSMQKKRKEKGDTAGHSVDLNVLTSERTTAIVGPLHKLTQLCHTKEPY